MKKKFSLYTTIQLIFIFTTIAALINQSYFSTVALIYFVLLDSGALHKYLHTR